MLPNILEMNGKLYVRIVSVKKNLSTAKNQTLRSYKAYIWPTM